MVSGTGGKVSMAGDGGAVGKAVIVENPCVTLIFSHDMSTPPLTPAGVRATPEPAAGPPSQALQDLRTRHQVRALTPEEEGTAIAVLPSGVYGFTYAPGQPEVPLFSKNSYHSFEMHKAADGTEYVLGFVTPSEASD